MSAALLSNLSELKILVIGDLMIDHYMWGKFERISPEAPVPIVDITKEEITLGGAGNVLKNLKSFGVKTDVVSVIGEDYCANELCTLLEELQIDLKSVFREAKRITSKKTRVLASNHQMIRIDNESKIPINYQSETSIINFVKENIINYNVVLISDYLKGNLTNNVLTNVIKYARDNNVVVVVDPKGDNYSKYAGANIVKPNKKEAAIATGMTITDIDSLHEAANALRKQIKADTIVITLSEEGIAICDDHFEIIPTKASEVFDVTGAGDTVLASIGICIAAGMPIKEACIFANHAAAIVVSKIGSAVTTVNEVLKHIEDN